MHHSYAKSLQGVKHNPCFMGTTGPCHAVSGTGPWVTQCQALAGVTRCQALACVSCDPVPLYSICQVCCAVQSGVTSVLPSLSVLCD